ncbi:GIY-YIG nuclease family protein [Cellulomonas sp. KRMCY2]|uniref:GIY-YIG nuclease family protein n=1 Tax=Cellulomonas sp. KRMCY2 TaxID=1304865 RepID=UPI00045E659A|nr:GIY-YIG nuclease family protein [Cellulomonas sp. KRMCY2]
MGNAAVSYDGGRWYVYALIDPATYRQTGSQLLSVIYVGKGTKDRADQHVNDERNALKHTLTAIPMSGSKSERIQWLLGSGETIPAITLVSGLVNEDDAYKTETLAMELIGRLLSAHGLDPLTNATPGHGQSAGMAVTGMPQSLGGPEPATVTPAPVKDEPAYEIRSVARALQASTSVRVDWRAGGVIPRPTVLVKGSSDTLPGGSHPHLPASSMPSGLVDVADRITLLGSDVLPESEFTRRGYDPDQPWSDHEARERAARYWPFARSTVRKWLDDPDTMPTDLLLAIPGSGGTTVRYAWEIDRTAKVEYFPDMNRWGFPLGQPLLDHPALGRCLVEDREARTGVQALANHISGCRLLLP